MSYVIGIDPDSKAHGVALYKDGKLIELSCQPLAELVDNMTRNTAYKLAVWYIEDVSKTKAVWHKGGNTTAVNVGLCIQAQRELERFLNYFDIKYINYAPSKQWKKDKKQFELVTEWKGRSNEDTRSAAYFGWLGCTK